jgi:hypothetical protein
MRSYSLIAAYCCDDLNPRSMTSVGSFGGSFFAYRDEDPAFPSICPSGADEERFGWEIEDIDCFR